MNCVHKDREKLRTEIHQEEEKRRVNQKHGCFQVKRAVLHKTHYVELLLVVDNDRVRHTHTHNTCTVIKPRLPHPLC